jgi:hypothetical protein
MTRSIPRFPSSNRRNYTIWHSPTFGPNPGVLRNTHKNKPLGPWHYRCGYSADAHGRHSGHTHRLLRDRTADRSGGGLHERVSDVPVLRGARDFDRRPRRRLCDVHGLRPGSRRTRTLGALSSSRTVADIRLHVGAPKTLVRQRGDFLPTKIGSFQIPSKNLRFVKHSVSGSLAGPLLR